MANLPVELDSGDGMTVTVLNGDNPTRGWKAIRVCIDDGSDDLSEESAEFLGKIEDLIRQGWIIRIQHYYVARNADWLFVYLTKRTAHDG